MAFWALIFSANILRCLFLTHPIVFTFFMLQNHFYVICTSVKYLVLGEVSMSLYLEAKWKFSTIASSLDPCNHVTGSIFYIICSLLNFLWGSAFCLNQVAIHIYLLCLLLPNFIFKYLLHVILCQIWRIQLFRNSMCWFHLIQ